MGGSNSFIVGMMSRSPLDPNALSFAQTATPVPGATVSAVGDVEGDGIEEAVTLSFSGRATPTTVTLLQSRHHDGVPVGGFDVLEQREENDYALADVAFADMDGDGRAEILAGDFGDYAPPRPAAVLMYRVQAQAPFLADPVILDLATQGSPGTMEFAVRDQGGSPDEVVLRYRDNFGNAAAVLTFDGTQLVASTIPATGETADVDRDGDLDVIATSSANLEVYLGPIASTPIIDQVVPVQADDGLGGTETGTTTQARLVDLNRDGLLDIAAVVRPTAATSESRIWVYYQDAANPGSFGDIAEQWLCGLPVSVDCRFADVTDDGRYDLLVGTSVATDLYPQAEMPSVSCATPRLVGPSLSVPGAVTAPHRAVWDANADGRTDLVTVVPSLNELQVWSGQQGVPSPPPSRTLAPPPITDAGFRGTFSVTSPLDRGGRPRTPDTITFSRISAGARPDRHDWRMGLDDAGLGLPPTFVQLTDLHQLAGDVRYRRTVVGTEIRRMVEPRLGALVAAQPTVVRGGLDLTAGSDGVVVEMPFRREQLSVDVGASTVRVFLRPTGYLTAADIPTDPLTAHADAARLIAQRPGLDGVMREVWRNAEPPIEISEASLASGSGPRFEVDTARRIVRVLLDRGGEIVAYVDPP